MEVTVLDDEFPPGVTLEMSADDTSVEEGESATLTFTFQTQPLEEPHADAGTFTLSVTGDSGDYTLSPTEITVPASAFEQIGYDPHFVETQRGPFTATFTATFTALEDGIAEPNEDFTISVARGTGAQTSIDLPDDLTLRILGARSSDLPEFSIRSGQGGGTLPTESDGSISFEITRPGTSMSDVRLTVRVSEDGNMIKGWRSQDRTITIDRNSTARRIHVQLQNDGQNEAHSNITAQILGGEGYEVSPTGGSAVQRVMDDDSPNPKFSIKSGHSPLLVPTESDGPVIFEITRPGTSTSDVALTVRLSEDGNKIRGWRSQDRTINIGKDAVIRRIYITLEGDRVYEAHSNITAQILDGEGYEVSPTGGSAEQQVMDDDFPDAKASISVSPGTIDEGGEVTVAVTLTTSGDEQPHGWPGNVLVRAVSGAGIAGATAGQDFTALDQDLMFWMTEFERQDIDEAEDVTDYRWVATKTVTLTTEDDDLLEAAESFTLEVAKVTPEMERGIHTITGLEFGDDASAEVTINASDDD